MGWLLLGGGWKEEFGGVGRWVVAGRRKEGFLGCSGSGCWLMGRGKGGRRSGSRGVECVEEDVEKVCREYLQ